MFERLARWLLLYLALALTLLGRPSEACDTRQADDEARRAETSETALISEGRRMPSLKRAGSEVRSSKSQAGQLLAGAAVTRLELAPPAVIEIAEPTTTTVGASQTHASAAHARGPPVLAG